MRKLTSEGQRWRKSSPQFRRTQLQQTMRAAVAERLAKTRGRGRHRHVDIPRSGLEVDMASRRDGQAKDRTCASSLNRRRRTIEIFHECCGVVRQWSARFDVGRAER